MLCNSCRLAALASTVITALVLAGCATRDASSSHSFQLDERRVGQLYANESLTILQPKVSLVQHRLADDPVQMTHRERRMELGLMIKIGEEFDRLGYVVNRLRPQQHDQRFVSFRLVSILERLLPGTMTAELPSLGPMVNQLDYRSVSSTPENARLLMVSLYRGQLKSAGQRRKERMAALLRSIVSLGRQTSHAPPVSSGQLWMWLLNAHSGDVLWQGHGSTAPEQLDQLVEDLLATLPGNSARFAAGTASSRLALPGADVVDGEPRRELGSPIGIARPPAANGKVDQ